ncbi:hypothetical protein [Virgisporangium ochraceum]|uniref:hypothetical protein n=1 Tax=Virgisporangium ochraceum TaxID=65505 RepID=UPI00194345F0|nr:hypothetical protein [Virgisporangium ochraceum]
MHDAAGSSWAAWMCGVVLSAAAVVYVIGVVAAFRRGRWWPVERVACWTAGLVAAAAA